jgi:hypothetical protein
MIEISINRAMLSGKGIWLFTRPGEALISLADTPNYQVTSRCVRHLYTDRWPLETESGLHRVSTRRV